MIPMSKQIDNRDTEKRGIRVACAIIVRDGRVLSTQRGYGDYAGWWEFPGGKIEPGEAPEDALVREIREELDAEIAIDRFFCSTEHEYPKFHLVMQCYLCTLLSRDVRLLEHRGAAWVGHESAYALKWLEADLPVIEQLIAEGII
jgi:8-oxo-dGTP diphosphatase